MTLSSTIAGLLLSATLAAPGGMAKIPGGDFRPVFPPSVKETVLRVEPFLLDVTPVTNAQFERFVKTHPKWRRDRVPRVFADKDYLAQWAAPERAGKNVDANAPVTKVSWFAAKAYCQARGARLPTESEWELAAAASESKTDGREDPEYTARILQWYAEPTGSRLAPVGMKKANAYGVHDLHGLAWEWVSDFGNTMLNTDSRTGSKDPNRFCGGGAAAAGDKRDYAAFMRVAFRGSLRASYTLGTLGFRCAMDAGEAR